MLTPQSIQSDAAKRAAAAKDAPLCYKNALRDPVSFVEFQPDAHTRSGFAVSQLLQYTIDTDPPKANGQSAPPERLELGFSTADVTIRGARLALLVELIATNKLVAVQTVAADAQARYANLYPAEPWVASITVTRFDRPSGAAG